MAQHPRICPAIQRFAPRRRLFLLVSTATTVLLVLGSIAHVRQGNDVGRSRLGRQLQEAQSALLTTVVDAVVPFFQPRAYPLQPVEAFNLYEVCTDVAADDCDQRSVIKFTTNLNSGPTEFRYQDIGPAQMQGVFWAQMDLLNFFVGPTDLISFAQTRHGGGVQTGRLGKDQHGYDYVVRPVGDHTWSRPSNDPAFYLTYFDVLYLFNLRDGTLDNPRRFVITPSFKLFSSCFRINLGWVTNLLLRFEMDLISDPSSRYLQQYPNSVVWNRKTTWAGVLSLTYPAIQIIDGNGNPVEPAYSMWKQQTPRNFIVGLNPNRMDEQLLC